MMAEPDSRKLESVGYAYIPLGSFIILLMILLTCASRRKKVDAMSAVETSVDSDYKGEYTIMCFPCLKNKPDISDYNPTADLSDQFEYIVEKYTVRKVPLLLANTAEDIIERQEELQKMAETTDVDQAEASKGDYGNFEMPQEMYNLQRLSPCIAMAANTMCQSRKTMREGPMPSDILESMSPITRPAVKNANYVVIPTKGSLRHKDIMITKREITNQYLNNFSSVFVDNLKDQVPKDPEQFPNLSRPYTSAFRNLPLDKINLKGKGCSGKKGKRSSKVQRVAYSFPAEDDSITGNGYGLEKDDEDDDEDDDDVVDEEDEDDNDEDEEDEEDEDGLEGSDLGGGRTIDPPESEVTRDGELEADAVTDEDRLASKSGTQLDDTDCAESVKEGTDNFSSRFKTTIKSSVSETDGGPHPSRSIHSIQHDSGKGAKNDFKSSKVTYEDIQALDVGYEFKSCEKLGVKPKMTRILYPHETDRSKEMKQVGETKLGRRNYIVVEQPSITQRFVSVSSTTRKLSDQSLLTQKTSPVNENASSKSILTETSFLPKIVSSGVIRRESGADVSLVRDNISSTTFTSKTDGSKSQSLNNLNENTCQSDTVDETVREISKLYDLPTPTRVESEGEDKFLIPSKTRSYQVGGRASLRKDLDASAKGNAYTAKFQSSYASEKSICRLGEPETETTYSLLSHDSKTSSAVTSPRSSEKDDRNSTKRATLRWKIIIKHHKADEFSRKHVNKNIKL